jgi:hypothetical protein
MKQTKYGFTMSSLNATFRTTTTFLQANDRALSHPEVRAMASLGSEDRFDLVIVTVLFGNEAGYYLAHKMNASLVLYCTGMVSYSW